MNFLYIAMLIPIFGIFFAAFTSFLKYRQHRAMLDVLKVYAEKGETPPAQVFEALERFAPSKEPFMNMTVEVESDKNRRPKSQGPAHYWSLVGLFSVFAGGFAYAAWLGGASGSPFIIVAVTFGAVAVWSLIMAIAVSFKK